VVIKGLSEDYGAEPADLRATAANLEWARK
jgi:hypothetical protein